MEEKFKLLTTDDIIALRPYFDACKLHLSDYSAAFKFMWQKFFAVKYAYISNCVVFVEEFKGKTYFHYPMALNEGDDILAINEIENYCRKNNIRLNFTCVPKSKLFTLIERYAADLKIVDHRRWKDYFYNASDFVTYGGKKFSGQRNHVNKFKKLYPNYQFVQLNQSDEGEIFAFLKEYEKRQLSKGTVIAKEEMQSVYDLLPYLDAFNLCVGGLKVEGKLIALSIGERCGDQLIVHVEKASTSYEGAYPTMAHEFAKHFVTSGVLYINREDDAGDPGLRKSKLQYNPIDLVDKYDLFPQRTIDRIARIPTLKTKRLTLKSISEKDAGALFKLESDEQRCKFWGYNWRDYLTETPTPEYFYKGVKEDFKNRDEMPMGIYLNGEMIGEVTLHNFGYESECEVGMRMLPEYEGNGYAKEAVSKAVYYALYHLNIERVIAKCHKQNEKSKRTLLSVGFRENGEDDTFYYFLKTAAM